MSNEENENIVKHIKKKKKFNFGYIYFFAFVFLVTLGTFSYFVNMYSPDIDVSIGNGSSLTLNEDDLDTDVKKIDERLKWIQMEDDMPSVAVRENERKYLDDEPIRTSKTKKERDRKETKESKYKQSERQIETVNEPKIRPLRPDLKDFRHIEKNNENPEKPAYTVTKIYLGKYSSLEDAIAVQARVAKEEPSIAPFVKAENDYYIVQLGSFSDKEKANTLVLKLKGKGFFPKVRYQ